MNHIFFQLFDLIKLLGLVIVILLLIAVIIAIISTIIDSIATSIAKRSIIRRLRKGIIDCKIESTNLEDIIDNLKDDE